MPIIFCAIPSQYLKQQAQQFLLNQYPILNPRHLIAIDGTIRIPAAYSSLHVSHRLAYAFRSPLNIIGNKLKADVGSEYEDNLPHNDFLPMHHYAHVHCISVTDEHYQQLQDQASSSETLVLDLKESVVMGIYSVPITGKWQFNNPEIVTNYALNPEWTDYFLQRCKEAMAERIRMYNWPLATEVGINYQQRGYFPERIYYLSRVPINLSQTQQAIDKILNQVNSKKDIIIIEHISSPKPIQKIEEKLEQQLREQLIARLNSFIAPPWYVLSRPSAEALRYATSLLLYIQHKDHSGAIKDEIVSYQAIVGTSHLVDKQTLLHCITEMLALMAINDSKLTCSH